MPRKRSRTRSRRSRRSRGSRRTAAPKMCPYKKNGLIVKKMTKAQVVSKLLKHLKVKTTTAAGKRKRAELNAAPVSELKKHLHGMMNKETEKKMKTQHDKKIQQLIKKGVIVKRTPKEKAVLRALGLGPGGSGMGMGGPRMGMMKVMICANGYCEGYKKKFRTQSGGCPTCGVVGSPVL